MFRVLLIPVYWRVPWSPVRFGNGPCGSSSLGALRNLCRTFEDSFSEVPWLITNEIMDSGPAFDDFLGGYDVGDPVRPLVWLFFMILIQVLSE